MPSLLEEMRGRLPQKRCRLGGWLESASKQDRADLEAAFADPDISGSLIADVLSSRIPGYIVDDIRRHRRGDCKQCPRELLNG